jgi:hypothetical protein
LILSKLLILNAARKAKKAPLPHRWYNFGTVISKVSCGNWGPNSLGEQAAGLVLGTQLLNQAPALAHYPREDAFPHLYQFHEKVATPIGEFLFAGFNALQV